ncbi:MAG TPA: hypothetical protein PK090_06510 [Smithellaceae bacterium]|nr:hypothetical protein [Smithellaceae bacterium]
MNDGMNLSFRMALACLLIAALAWTTPAAAQGRSATPVEGASFNVSASLKDNLKTYAGKEVVLHLKSGKTLQGRVKAVEDHLVHIEKLSGRDFFDALVRIEDIAAMEARFRELK